MKIDKLNLIKRFVLIILSIVCIVFATFAWFSSSKIVSVMPLSLSAVGPSKLIYELSIKENGGTWKPIEVLEYKNMVVSQEVEYRLQMKNISTAPVDASVSFLNITEATANQNVKLCDKLMLSKVNLEPVDSSAVLATTGSFTSLMGSGKNFDLVKNLNFAVNETVDILFSVKLDDTAGNIYQDKSITVGQLNIVHN